MDFLYFQRGLESRPCREIVWFLLTKFACTSNTFKLQRRKLTLKVKSQVCLARWVRWRHFDDSNFHNVNQPLHSMCMIVTSRRAYDYFYGI
jgi:hypothetical protein